MKKSVVKAALVVILATISTLSLAEGVLIKSEPKNNAEVSQFDGTIKLWFSGNVGERAPSVVVVDSKGNRVDNGDTRLVLGERHRLTATTKPLSPGLYVTRYRVVTEDGLIVSGVLKFSITDTPPTTEANP
jgi:methionine-rich copper-binding protein CopC